MSIRYIIVLVHSHHLGTTWYNVQVMEFERNNPHTSQEESLAEIPHVTIEPAHNDIAPDYTDAPSVGSPDADRMFEFEAESTEPVANTSRAGHWHALLVSAIVVVVFIAVLVLVFALVR